MSEMFFNGEGWSRSIEEARHFTDPKVANRTVDRLTRRHLRRHQPKRLILMTVVVRVHADEAFTRGDVESYLRDALVIGVDHKRCGMGPTPDSLVEVTVPLVSLEEGL